VQVARADLPGIKTAIQTILEDANTTTGSPIDLSDSLTSRVKKVLQINPQTMSQPQPSFFPCITMFYDAKDIQQQDIAASQLNGRMRGEIDIKIVGFVWIDNINTANFQYKDLADNECEQLMENIEQVLRSDPTLGGKAISARAVNVTYHTYPAAEDAHMRAGILTYKIRTQY
jgi:hypothetical protein